MMASLMAMYMDLLGYGFAFQQPCKRRPDRH